MKLIDLFHETATLLGSKQEAKELITGFFALSPDTFYLFQDQELVLTEAWKDALRRSLEKEPLAYILGNVAFYNLSLNVTCDVLIPRPETEQLVELAAAYIQENKIRHIVDLCTGSGCIALALKKQFPDLEVVAVDNSEKALEVAGENARINQLKIEFMLSDFSEGLKIPTSMIISNPPYISEEEYLHLDESVREYEPKEALVAQEEGLFFYKELALKAKCPLFLEIGWQQKEQVIKLFENAGWQEYKVLHDFAGHNRFFIAYK